MILELRSQAAQRLGVQLGDEAHAVRIADRDTGHAQVERADAQRLVDDLARRAEHGDLAARERGAAHVDADRADLALHDREPRDDRPAARS